jgi:hypothetical protein
MLWTKEEKIFFSLFSLSPPHNPVPPPPKLMENLELKKKKKDLWLFYLFIFQGLLNKIYY